MCTDPHRHISWNQAPLLKKKKVKTEKKNTYTRSTIWSHTCIVFLWKRLRRERCCLEDTGGTVGGGGGGTCILLEFFSIFSTEGTGGGAGDDGRGSFAASSCVIGFVAAFVGVEMSVSSSTSGTTNIYLDSHYFIQNDMILFTRLIFLLHLLSLLSLDLSFLT